LLLHNKKDKEGKSRKEILISLIKIEELSEKLLFILNDIYHNGCPAIISKELVMTEGDVSVFHLFYEVTPDTGMKLNDEDMEQILNNKIQEIKDMKQDLIDRVNAVQRTNNKIRSAFTIQISSNIAYPLNDQRYLGTIKPGERYTFEILSNNSHKVTGYNLGKGAVVTGTYDNGDINNRILTLWGAQFAVDDLNGIHHIKLNHRNIASFVCE
jgi:hypothetical protein